MQVFYGHLSVGVLGLGSKLGTNEAHSNSSLSHSAEYVCQLDFWMVKIGHLYNGWKEQAQAYRVAPWKTFLSIYSFYVKALYIGSCLFVWQKILRATVKTVVCKTRTHHLIFYEAVHKPEIQIQSTMPRSFSWPFKIKYIILENAKTKLSNGIARGQELSATNGSLNLI